MKNKIWKAIAITSSVAIIAGSFAGCTLNNVTTQTTTTSEPAGNGTETPVIQPGADWTQPGGGEQGNGQAQNPGAEGKTTKEDYGPFLNGEAPVLDSSVRANYLQFEKSYTLSELKDAINRSYEENWEGAGMTISEMKYGYIDCGNDSSIELALNVKARAADGYSEEDNYYIIRKFGDSFLIVDYYSSYYRSMGMLNRYGVYYSFGSGGASIAYESFSRVNAEGIHEFIYDCETQYALTEPVIQEYDLPSGVQVPDGYPMFLEEFGEQRGDKYGFMEYEDGFYDDDTIYDEYKKQHLFVFFDENGNVIYPKEEYLKLYEEAGLTVTDEAGIQNRIDQRLNELGIDRAELANPEENPDAAVEWNTIQ